MNPSSQDPTTEPDTRRSAGAATISLRAVLRLAGLGAAGLAVGGGAASAVVGAHRFDVEPIAATIPSLRSSLRLAWLSDLHGPFIGVGSVRRGSTPRWRRSPT
jgi:uncharacterized protein